MLVRRYQARDRGQVWALNHIPFKGLTADPAVPLELPAVAGPGHFEDLYDPEASFVAVGGEFLVVEEEARVVGMGGIKPYGGGVAEVLRVRVHPAFRRRGVGAALMTGLEAAAGALGLETMHLDTTTDQPEAIAFYRALGYTETGRLRLPDWELIFFTKPVIRLPGGVPADDPPVGRS